MAKQQQGTQRRDTANQAESAQAEETRTRRTLWFGTWSAIAGVVIAGLLTTGGTWVLQKQQHNREDEQQAEAAVGAARLLYRELATSEEALTVFMTDRILRPVDRSITVEVEPEDLRLIAETVDIDGWGAISFALARVDGAEGMTRSLMAQGRRRLNEREACVIEHDIRSITDGAYVLARLGGSKADPLDLPPIECTTEFPKRQRP